jgi:hypothetical protein
MVLSCLVQVLHLPQKFERPLFCNSTATALKLWLRGHLQWHDLPTEFLKNLPVGSKVDRWTNRKGDLINQLFSFRKECRLKTHAL